METDSKRKKSKWESPIIITVATAVIGLIGTAAGAVLQGFHETNLSRQKFESSLIFKALEPSDALERANYLKFLIDAGLVNSLDVKKIEDLASNPERLPSSSPELGLASSTDILSSPWSLPGGIEVDDQEKWDSWEDGGVSFAVSRKYKLGNVIAFGHDDILKGSGNLKNLKQSFMWLSKPSGKNIIAFSTDHCEWFPNRTNRTEVENLYYALQDWGYEVKIISESINDDSLDDVGVLVVGNAWGNIPETEINAIEKFVSKGGGFMAVGLGWSWGQSDQEQLKCHLPSYGENANDLSTYPMNRVFASYGARWTGKIIE